MEWDEILSLNDKVFECYHGEKNVMLSISFPKPDEYDSEAEGYKLHIKNVSESALNCIKFIVQKRKLRMMKLKECRVIYTPRKV